MKKNFVACMAVGIAALGGSVSAQVTIIDDFETGITGWTTQGFSDAAVHVTTDGADSTAGSLELQDAGFGFFGGRVYTAGTAAADGNYEVSFWWKNGVGAGGNPMGSVALQIDPAGGPVSGSSFVPVASLGSPGVVSTWTFVEGTPVALTAASDFTLKVTSSQGGVLAEPYTSRWDQIGIELLAALPIAARVTPISGNYLAGTVNVVVQASGGSESFTQAEFDVNNDSSVEFTDSTPGTTFTFSFDTTTVPDGPVDLAITVTDSDLAEETFIVSYVVANADGREELFFSDFETFTTGDPDGWTRVDIDGTGTAGSSTAVVAPDTTNPFGGTGTSLHIQYDANPDPFRYTLISDVFAANRYDYVLTAAMRGNNFTRIYYFLSTDGGTTFENTFQGITSGPSSVWVEFLHHQEEVTNSSTAQLAIATHMFGTGGYYADDVRVSASETINLVPAAANNWDLYY